VINSKKICQVVVIAYSKMAGNYQKNMKLMIVTHEICMPVAYAVIC